MKVKNPLSRVRTDPVDRIAVPSGRQSIRRIVSSYDNPIVRMYSRVRFIILREYFLEEIEQYLPTSGRILDIGCGFGLFSLYFASLEPRRRFLGIDLDARRIQYAQDSAKRLGLPNVEYRVGNAVDWDTDEKFDAIYIVDLLHHMPFRDVPEFLARLRSRLRDGGTLIVKEVENRPRWKMWFTLAVDRAMVGLEPIRYWPPGELIDVLRHLGFDVVKHRMRDYLPYPHILYVNRLPQNHGDRNGWIAPDRTR